jgi:hypothetical protein
MKMTVFWDVALCNQKFTDVSEVLTTSIITTLMMEAVSNSETSVNYMVQHPRRQSSSINLCYRNIKYEAARRE